MRQVVFGLFVLLFAVQVAAQTNPCLDLPTQIVLATGNDPTAYVAHGAWSTVASVELAVFPSGAVLATAAPLVRLVVPPAAFTLTAAQCYGTPVPAFLVPVGTPGAVLDVAVRFVGTDKVTSAWQLGNPIRYQRSAVPMVLSCAPLAGEVRTGTVRTIRAAVTTGTEAAKTIATWTAAGWVDIFWGSSTIVGVCRE